ncbi:hypothetical protein FXO37_31770 [Capsicum annuum]|nr:hypothetical protein FXO37_31770 [Capsicum annuum]
MSSLMSLDEPIFDLDMALTMPEPEICVCNNGSHREPITSMDVSFTQIVREMSTVEVVGSTVCTRIAKTAQMTIVNFQCCSAIVVRHAKIPGRRQGGNVMAPCRAIVQFRICHFPVTWCNGGASRQG